MPSATPSSPALGGFLQTSPIPPDPLRRSGSNWGESMSSTARRCPHSRIGTTISERDPASQAIWSGKADVRNEERFASTGRAATTPFTSGIRTACSRYLRPLSPAERRMAFRGPTQSRRRAFGARMAPRCTAFSSSRPTSNRARTNRRSSASTGPRLRVEPRRVDALAAAFIGFVLSSNRFGSSAGDLKTRGGRSGVGSRAGWSAQRC